MDKFNPCASEDYLYKLFYREPDRGEEHMIIGTLVNYANGNCVIHDEKNNKVAMVKYGEVIQLTPLRRPKSI